MKIAAFSDSHSLHSKIKIPKCDVLCCAGDYTGNGSILHLLNFREWLYRKKVENHISEVIVISGNHDEYAERNYDLTKKMFAELGIIYLQSEQHILPNGMRLWGEPTTPEFNNWSFMCPREEMYEKVWSRVPNDTEILLTHGPCYKVHDEVDVKYTKPGEDSHVGCKGLRKRIGELPNLKYVFQGHIHGHKKSPKMDSLGKVQIFNCSQCDEEYNIVNKPIVIDI